MASKVIQARISSLGTAGGEHNIPQWFTDKPGMAWNLFLSSSYLPLSSLIFFTFHFEKNSNVQKSCKNSSTPDTKKNFIYCSARSLILSHLLSLCVCVYFCY